MVAVSSISTAGFFCVCSIAQVTQIFIKQNHEPHIISSLLKEWELEWQS